MRSASSSEDRVHGNCAKPLTKESPHGRTAGIQLPQYASNRLRSPIQGTTMIRLLLVDNVPTFREPLAFMLDRQEGISVVGQAETLPDAQAVLATTEVDVVLMAFDLGPQERLELVRTLRDTQSAAVIVMLAGDLDQQTRAVAVAAGAVGIVHRSLPVADLVTTVRRAAAGAPLLNPADVLQDAVLRQVRQDEAERALERLTPREVDVLRALAAGLDTQSIAERLGIGERTVHSHVEGMLGKLDVPSRLQAVLFALRHGFLDLNDLDD
jgi:DNA-binding NarL/FixJ family response regulator